MRIEQIRVATMGIEGEDLVWSLVFPLLQLSDLCKVRATCKTWYHSKMVMDIAKHKKADPWIMYSCDTVEYFFGCGLWAWKPCSLLENNCAVDESNCTGVSHMEDRDFNYDDWHNHYAPPLQGSKPYHLVKLSLGEFLAYKLYEVYGTASSGLMVIHFTSERKIVLSTPVAMKDQFKALPEPNYIDLQDAIRTQMCDELLCVEEHRDGLYVILVNRNNLYKRKPDVYLDVVEIYDSRTGSWREGKEYLLGTNVQHPCTQFKLGEFLMLSKDRKRVATYDVEEDSWREYEFYSLLPKLDNANLYHHVIRIKKYADTKLIVVSVVAQELEYVVGDLSVWIIEVGSTPLRLFNVDRKEMVRQRCHVEYIEAFIAEGCVAISFRSSKIHLPDIVYDFELGHFYSCVSSDCRRLSMKTVVRPRMNLGGNKILQPVPVKQPDPDEECRKRKRREELFQRKKKLNRMLERRWSTL